MANLSRMFIKQQGRDSGFVRAPFEFVHPIFMKNQLENKNNNNWFPYHHIKFMYQIVYTNNLFDVENLFCDDLREYC